MRRIPLIAVVLALAPLLAIGAERVVFDDGRELRVRSIEVDGDLARLEFEDGGALTLPLANVVSVEPVATDAEPAAPPVVAPAPMVIPPVHACVPAGTDGRRTAEETRGSTP